MSYTVPVNKDKINESGLEPKNHPVNFNNLLEQVNRIRKALAIGEGTLEELPPGKLGAPYECVLARALSNGWKTSVSDTLELYPPKEIRRTFDFEAAARSLRKLGFHAWWQNESSRPSEQCVVVQPTKTMVNFIERFDAGQFPTLIFTD